MAERVGGKKGFHQEVLVDLVRLLTLKESHDDNIATLPISYPNAMAIGARYSYSTHGHKLPVSVKPASETSAKGDYIRIISHE